MDSITPQPSALPIRRNAGDSKIEYHSAYTELSKKLYANKVHGADGGRSTKVANGQNYELLLSPHAAKEIENRHHYASKELQDNISQRLLRSGELMDQHSKALMQAYVEKELEECTFHPKLVNDNVQRRSMKQFLDDQNGHRLKVENKREQRKEKIEEQKRLTEGSYKPALCSKSLKILAKKKRFQSGGVHNRLYKISKNAQQKQMQDIAENEELNLDESNYSSQFIGNLSNASRSGLGEKEVTFVPNIHKKSRNLKRDGKIDNILYNDALRRQKKPIDVSVQSRQPAAPLKISEGSRKALASRFIREFDLAILDFLAPDREPKLDYLQLNTFLRRLAFLKDSEAVELPHFTPERSLLFEMWYTLYADKHDGIHRRNLLVFLLAVMGLHYQITKIEVTGEGEGDEHEVEAEQEPVQQPSQHSIGKHSQSLQNDLETSIQREGIPEERMEDTESRSEAVLSSRKHSKQALRGPSKTASKAVSKTPSKTVSRVIQDSGANQQAENDKSRNDLSRSKQQHLDDDQASELIPIEGVQAFIPRHRKKIGSFDAKGNYELSEDEVRKIHDLFNIWYINRLGSPDNIGQMIISRRVEEPSYHPEINDYSRTIAHLHREKILEGTTELIQASKIPAAKDGKLTHADLLMLSKRVAREKMDQEKLNMADDELKDCTFKPQTNDFSQASRMLGKSGQRSQMDDGDDEGRHPADAMGQDRTHSCTNSAKATSPRGIEIVLRLNTRSTAMSAPSSLIFRRPSLLVKRQAQ